LLLAISKVKKQIERIKFYTVLGEIDGELYLKELSHGYIYIYIYIKHERI